MKPRTRIFYITKVHGGRYMVSKFAPQRGLITGTQIPEVDCPFDPTAIRHLCEPGVVHMLGTKLPPLTPRRIRITVELLED